MTGTSTRRRAPDRSRGTPGGRRASTPRIPHAHPTPATTRHAPARSCRPPAPRGAVYRSPACSADFVQHGSPLPSHDRSLRAGTATMRPRPVSCRHRLGPKLCSPPHLRRRSSPVIGADCRAAVR